MTVTAAPSAEGGNAPATAEPPQLPANEPSVDGSQAQQEEERARREAKKHAILQFVMWLVFAVIFAVLPTAIQYLNGRQTVGYEAPGFLEMASKAQLYLVAMGLTAQALGQAIGHLLKAASFRLALITVANALVLVVAALLASTADGPDKIASVVGQQSLMLFVAALLSAGSSTWICVGGTRP
ncbi:hypothetical protein [Streptomyces sp. NPDC048057]|uniref:hypothetical protein n=1 Tax=Streptomyces sp. NPDC048057 TaxID=3155628 RepID=UPI003409A6A8